MVVCESNGNTGGGPLRSASTYSVSYYFVLELLYSLLN